MTERAEQKRKQCAEHYIKYCKVADIYGIKLPEGFMSKRKNDWLELAKQDINLNNTPLSKWDSFAFQISKQQREELRQVGVNGWALYLGACTYKTLVYRDILKMNADEYCDFHEKHEG